MTPNQIKFIELEKKKVEVKKYFEELQESINALVEEMGIDSYFNDDDGTVYKIVVPNGKFVKYEKYGYKRTRRAFLDEKKGDLSLKEAKEAGYTVE